MKIITQLIILLIPIFTIGQSTDLSISTAQQKEKVLSIDTEPLYSLSTDFTFVEVIDKRGFKNNIGFTQSKVNAGKLQYLDLERELTIEVNDLLDKLMDLTTETPEELVMFIHDLSISEWRKVKGTQSLLGHCVLDVEYLKLRDSNYVSLGRFITEEEFSGVGMRKSHDKRIMESFKNNIIKFMISGWKNIEGQEIQNHKYQTALNYDDFPKSGLYYNFNKLIKNEPLDPLKYKLIPRDKDARNKRYQLAFKDKQKSRNKRIQFISDGEDLYINSNFYGNTESFGYPGSYFIKAKQYGKYIYFVDKLPNSIFSIGFGLTGAAASNFDRPMLLDSSTGEFFILNEKRLLELIKEFPDLQYDYQVSDKFTKDIEEIIVKLNER